LRAAGSGRGGGRRVRLVGRVVRQVKSQLEWTFGEGSAEWRQNVSVHAWLSDTEEAVSVRVYFPTYHGERETFNGFCEDKTCECTGQLAPCHRHPECLGKHMCAPLPRGSSSFVERARHFARALMARDLPQPRERHTLLSDGLSPGRPPVVSPWYDDCWPGRGRCQGNRPCKEPLDQAFSCRATALLCPAATWQQTLAAAKAWIPEGRPSASLLYLYDGHWDGTLFDETFRVWGPASVGYGAHAVVFGSQFGKYEPTREDWPSSLRRLTTAMQRQAACAAPPSGNASAAAPLLIFRSPAFNFDVMNKFSQQEAYEAKMRPLVEKAGAFYLDQYAATKAAAFQEAPAIKFAQGSTFHYLNAGRYLMAQTLLHLLQLLTHGAPGEPGGELKGSPSPPHRARVAAGAVRTIP